MHATLPLLDALSFPAITRGQLQALQVSRFGVDDLDRAIADEVAHGYIKVLTLPGKDRILGVTIVGEHAGELIAEYVAAMKQGYGLNKMLGTIHIYPTMAEANKYVAGKWKCAHAPAAALRWGGVSTNGGWAVLEPMFHLSSR